MRSAGKTLSPVASRIMERHGKPSIPGRLEKLIRRRHRAPAISAMSILIQTVTSIIGTIVFYFISMPAQQLMHAGRSGFSGTDCRPPRCSAGLYLLPRSSLRQKHRRSLQTMSQRNRFFAFLGFAAGDCRGLLLSFRGPLSDLVLIGTVDANQVVVSPKITDASSGWPWMKARKSRPADTVAVLDSQELTADRQAAEAVLASLRHQVSQTRATEEQTAGETSSGVVNAEARIACRRRLHWLQAQADLQRIQGDTRRSVALAQQGVASQQQADQAEAQLKAQQALVRAAEDQVRRAGRLVTAQAHTRQTQAAQSTVAVHTRPSS